jgi:hypothetical protein
MLCSLKPYGCRIILGDDARSRADWFAREFEIVSGVRLEQLKRLHGPQDGYAARRYLEAEYDAPSPQARRLDRA